MKSIDDIFLSIYIYIYISLVFSPIGLGLPLHNIPSSGVLLMKRVLEQSFYDRMPFLVSTTGVGCSIIIVLNMAFCLELN